MGLKEVKEICDVVWNMIKELEGFNEMFFGWWFCVWFGFGLFIVLRYEGDMIVFSIEWL